MIEAERRKCAPLEEWAPPNARVVWGRAEEQPLDLGGVAVAKALAQPPTAVEWCLPLVREGGAVVLWVGPSAEPRARRPRRRAARRRARRVFRRLPRRPQDGPDAGRFSPAHRPREEAPARLRAGPVPPARLAGCPARSTRSRTRRAESARRRRRSISRRASRRQASGRSSSTSTRRRTRHRGSGCERTTSTYDLLDGAPLSELAKPTQFENFSSSRRSRTRGRRGRARTVRGRRPLSGRVADDAEGFDFVLLDCPPHSVR